MTHSSRDLSRDLHIVRAITQDLKSYLLGDVLYMELGRKGVVGPQLPKGTLGGLLFRLDLLEKLSGQLDPAQWEETARLRDEAHELLRHWAVQAEQKAVREIGARLRTWNAFLEDAERDPAHHNVEYATQVENRVIIEYLLRFAGPVVPETSRDLLAAADRKLMRISGDDAFVWNPDLQSAFPEDRFPWLYVRLR